MGERAKNKIFGVIYGRTAVVLLLLLLQIGIMVFTLTFLENYASYLYGVFVLLSMAAVIYIINEEGALQQEIFIVIFYILTLCYDIS